jgi:hypothetical protein
MRKTEALLQQSLKWDGRHSSKTDWKATSSTRNMYYNLNVISAFAATVILLSGVSISLYGSLHFVSWLSEN